MSTDQVTVVIPTRADGRGLDRAVRSVLRQLGLKPTVLVVVDGASIPSDKDRACLEALAPPHRAVLAGHQGRPAPLRNLGVELTQSPWVAFLDDDDEWDAEKLVRQLELLRSSGAVLVGSNATRIQGGQVLGPYFEPPPPWSISLSDALLTNWLITSTVLTATSALRRVGGFPEEDSMRFCDDYVAWLKLLTLGEGRIVGDQLVRYSVGSANSLSDIDAMSGAEVRRVAAQRLLDDTRHLDLKIGWRARRHIRKMAMS